MSTVWTVSRLVHSYTLARTGRVVRGEAPGRGFPHRSPNFLVAMREKEAVVLETWGRPALSAGVAALGRLLWAFKKPARLGRKNGSRVCGRWLGGGVETDPSAVAAGWRWGAAGGVHGPEGPL